MKNNPHLFSSNRSSSPELACCMRYISFSKSCLQKSCPARRTNCSPFCNGWQQTTHAKQGKWKTCCCARITISCGKSRSPHLEHFTPNILQKAKGKFTETCTRLKWKFCSWHEHHNDSENLIKISFTNTSDEIIFDTTNGMKGGFFNEC